MLRRRNFAVGAACAVGYGLYYGVKAGWFTGEGAPFSVPELLVLIGCVAALVLFLGDGDGTMGDWFESSDSAGDGGGDGASGGD